ncbi:MAG TPA: Sec-dependent nitrous-oxide reductase [Sediminibacterium sp.]|jgi:nitrous-oxide reductase|uniref:Sec-dependent nitrous-oxide reductase n=1 Tax=Sediminibacterium sp. TaxID=1917865 RepID=UPI0008D7C1D6|nr:Sec-dependent nitrous-oxide reductase [Sediminibacterium sp.]OHC84993.1 MAG: nitrous oxide reductase [Sphingobacteriia bacterium RIFOXYC2_FULL_35_18]OHC89243.1 MAG: nitrous oxide reductase [Sphingobacteriia bacterium RIFOXYD2_FULL_35_12]OYY08748.1 MAG: nitrous oxide reductase [Sphingobacteriia bacterium 35-36-14]OYZ55600.1 MAG: nitrous oxide reductase [Sphingobacteriia bacterium 24-36-13]OZA64651.1 MAG: nitrous oxide reductase [Sphingobacteriia bacterium 39-36-14]
MKLIQSTSIAAVISAAALFSCKPKSTGSAVSGDAAAKAYVAPGKYDEFYNFVSGGFSGQMSVYGLPSGRLLRVIPVFSVDPEKGWGYSEETKPMLNTSHGFVPWDDLHHTEMSQTNGEIDGKWVFANGNNTPRLARIDLKTFKTAEIIELPNSAGNHSSPFGTENSEYIVAGTRFSVPSDEDNGDVPINSYKKNFKGHISFVSVAKETGEMKVAFQLKTPGVNFDLARAGKGKSHGWFFFSCYNTEQASTLLEVNASQKDKDFIMAVNWKKAEEYIKAGKGKKVKTKYAHNTWNEATHTATSKMEEEVLVLDVKEFKDIVYFIPCPKSPHGCDVDPTGEYIVGSGKLAALIPVFSFDKIQQSIAAKSYDGDYEGIPVIKYESALFGEVKKPGLGPLHTEFDGRGNAYTSFFVSSEVVKWNIKDLKVLDRVPTYYSVGHLSIPGGNTKKPNGKYLVAYNKITKDRYLPTGPELAQSAQLYDISGDKMQLILDYPTIGEPHYAQSAPADIIRNNGQLKLYKLSDNKHPYVTQGEANAKVTREGNKVHVYMTSIRSHFAPDNIEGIKVGDEVYFHVTNLEQDWDVPHGFAIKGADNAELLIMPGETTTLKWLPKKPGMFPMYCTDFCSALHQEMQGYIRVSPAGSNVPLSFSLGKPVPETK